MKDFLIVGAGLYGLTFAREATDLGATCTVVERRPVIGGNCRSEFVEGIDVHTYGPHIFHSSNPETLAFVRRFGDFDRYVHTAKAYSRGTYFSWPINLQTLNQTYGAQSPADAERLLRTVTTETAGEDFELYCLRTIGRTLYEKFYAGFTRRMWGMEPKDLPASIAARIPVGTTFEDRYFLEDAWVPRDGWGRWLGNLRPGGLEVGYGTAFSACSLEVDWKFDHIVYSGSTDELFGYRFGPLPYRSLDFTREVSDGDALGGSWITYPDADAPYTRAVEYKFLNLRYRDNPRTVVVREKPRAHVPGQNEPLYPIPTRENLDLHAKYMAEAATIPNLTIGGRLGLYRYMNMDTTIELARAKARELMGVKDDPVPVA